MTKNITFIDLLYPENEYVNHKLSEFSFIDELDLYNILELNKKNFDLSQYFTKSKEVIEYRNNILSDFTENNCLANLEEIIGLIKNINEIRESKKQASEIVGILYTVFEIEFYINLIEYLKKFLNQHNFTSAALTNLKQYLEFILSSENYINLKENLKNFRMTVDNIKSFTIGVNLNRDLKPYEAGVVSVNSTNYRSGNLFDRILSLDTKDDGYRCLAPLSPVRGDRTDNQALMIAFNNALENIIKNNLKSWQAVIKDYIVENTNYFINMANDLKFYCALLKYINKCRQNGFYIAKPEIISDAENIRCKNIYNIQVALHSEELIYNDVEFDENGQVYILTGPNQGGKSVFLKALGINQALFQLGGYVNASQANLKISPNIIVYLTKNDERSIGYGHLGEECSAVSDLLKYAGKNCMVLFDEAFSSTSASDQCYIAREVLKALSELQCYGIFTTHNYDIYDKTKEIASMGSLVALMKNDSGERSYKIARKAPDRNSYAMDIAKKYNLQYDDILKGVL